MNIFEEMLLFNLANLKELKSHDNLASSMMSIHG